MLLFACGWSPQGNMPDCELLEVCCCTTHSCLDAPIDICFNLCAFTCGGKNVISRDMFSTSSNVLYVGYHMICLRAQDPFRRRINPHQFILHLIWMARPFDLQFAVDSGAAAADKAICRWAMILPAPIICLDFNFTALGNEYCVDLRGPELHLLDPLIESDQAESELHPTAWNVWKYLCSMTVVPNHTST